MEVEKVERMGEFEIVCPERLKYEFVVGVLDVVGPMAGGLTLVTRAE